MIGYCGYGELFNKLEYGGEPMQACVWDPQISERWEAEGKGSANWVKRATAAKTEPQWNDGCERLRTTESVRTKSTLQFPGPD